jgi:DNA-binding SARP family transcriptional activator
MRVERLAVKFSILGPLEISDGNQRPQRIPFKQRVVLGLLLCRANRVVPVSALMEALWEDDPPRTAHKNLQVYVSALRRMLGPPAGDSAAERLQYRPPGYIIRLGGDELDALRFQELVQAGRRAARAGDPATAADLLSQAMRLWRGPVLPALASIPAIAAEAEKLNEQYVSAYEDWAEAKLSLGQPVDVVETVDALVQRYPLRERLRHAQMLALYRAGRQTEALAAFDTTRQMLARELGLPPTPVLTRLYELVLAGDPSLSLVPPERLPPSGVRTVATGRTRLTRDIPHFTGRRRQVDMLLNVLSHEADGGLTAVTGPAGVGKSAIAVHCAHRLGDRFPDGRIFIDMRTPEGQPRPTADLLADLLRGMRVGGPLPDGTPERAALLREGTYGRRMLFVLDDVATESQVRAVLGATGDGAVLVTSRRHLGGLDLAVHIGIAPLLETEALELLGRLIGPDRIAAEPVAARRLVDICGGLPLLVRIVGNKLNGLRHLSLARWAERLSDERRLLDELAAGDIQIRSRLAVWYQDLPEEDRVTLHAVARLPTTTFTPGDLAPVLGTDELRAEAAIERLIETHLVEVNGAEVNAHGWEDSVQYTLPPLIRLYVRERVGDPHTGAIPALDRAKISAT